MSKPDFCVDCSEYDKAERECVLGPTKPFKRACRSFKPGVEVMKGLLVVAAGTTGGCSAVNVYTTNEMLAAIVTILFCCLVWQVSVVLWQCRARRKRTEALMKVRRYGDGKPS